MAKSIINTLPFPITTGLLFVVAGICILTLPIKDYNSYAHLYGVPFIISGISDIVFAIRNRKIMFHEWIWYIVFGGLTAGIGYYLNTLDSNGLFFDIGAISIFRLGILVGLSAETRKYGHTYWKYILIAGICGIILSFLLTIEVSKTLMTGLVFIIIGITSVLQVLAFRKVIQYYKPVKNFSKDIDTSESS